MYENVQEWTDANMRWNTSEYSDIKDIRLPPARLWKPDILMYNRSVLCALHSAPRRQTCKRYLTIFGTQSNIIFGEDSYYKLLELNLDKTPL